MDVFDHQHGSNSPQKMGMGRQSGFRLGLRIREEKVSMANGESDSKRFAHEELMESRCFISSEGIPCWSTSSYWLFKCMYDREFTLKLDLSWVFLDTYDEARLESTVRPCSRSRQFLGTSH